jgi:hypothetical protein
MYLKGLGRRSVKCIRVLHGVLSVYFLKMPIPLAALFKAWVCGRSLAWNVGSNPSGDMDVCLL